MSLTNKQAAARIVKKALTEAVENLHRMTSKEIASVAEKNRLSDDNAEAVKGYALGFFKSSQDRVDKICDKVDTPIAGKGEGDGEE